MRILISLLAVAVLAVVTPVYGTINVDIFSGFVNAGGGAPFSDYVGSFPADDVRFAENTGYDWHPFGLPSFGARITGFIQAESETTLPFTLGSDDGSLLFIDGVLVMNNGGAHPPLEIVQDITLTAGVHSFEIQFYEDHGGSSGVDLRFQAEGVRYADAVPEPTAIIVWSMLGVTGIFYGWRKRKAL